MVIVAKPSILAGKAPCIIIACRFSYHRMVELHCLSAFGFGKNGFGGSRRNAQLFHMPCHYKTAYNKRNLTAFCEAVKPAGILSAVAHKRIFSAFIRIGIDLESVTLRVVSPGQCAYTVASDYCGKSAWSFKRTRYDDFGLSEKIIRTVRYSERLDLILHRNAVCTFFHHGGSAFYVNYTDKMILADRRRKHTVSVSIFNFIPDKLYYSLSCLYGNGEFRLSFTKLHEVHKISSQNQILLSIQLTNEALSLSTGVSLCRVFGLSVICL